MGSSSLTPTMTTSCCLLLLSLAVVLQLAATLPTRGRDSDESTNLTWKFSNNEELLAIINQMEPGLGATILKVYLKGWLGGLGDDEEVQRRHLIENIQAVTGQDARILEEMTNEELVGIFSELNSVNEQSLF